MLYTNHLLKYIWFQSNIKFPFYTTEMCNYFSSFRSFEFNFFSSLFFAPFRNVFKTKLQKLVSSTYSLQNSFLFLLIFFSYFVSKFIGSTIKTLPYSAPTIVVNFKFHFSYNSLKLKMSLFCITLLL